MDFEEITNQQYELGNQIKQLIDNCKKAPRERRTSQFYGLKIKQLQELGQTFFNNNEKILAIKDKPLDDNYFLDKYYERINNVLIEYTKNLEKRAVELANSAEATNTDKDRPPSRQEDESEEASSSTRKILRNQKALLRALNRNLEEISSRRGEEHPPVYYTIKANLLDKYMTDFESNNVALWETTDKEEIDGYTLQTYYDMAAKVEAAMVDLQQHVNPEPAPTNVPRPTEQSAANIQLPRISLPKFNGDYLQWTEFKELFIELVHHSTISNSEKMHYLSQSLVDEPKRLLKHLPSTGSNYEAAWEILRGRYDNKRLLVSTLLNKLLLQPAIKSESPAAMKSLHDVTKECLHGLLSHGLPVQYWDTVVAHIVLQKMDQTTQTAFDQSIDDNKRLITLEELLRFLERRFQSLEVRTNTERSSKRVCGSLLNAEGNCQLCKKDNHRVHECTTFKKASIKQKWYYVKTNRLCSNCLKPGHQSNVCKSSHCTKCKKYHHTLLHPEENKPKNQQANASLVVASSVQEEQDKPQTTSNSNAVSLLANQPAHQDNFVLLGTAKIILVGKNGNATECKAVLDSGSQVNLITEKMLKKLGVSTEMSNLHLEGIGVKETSIRHRTFITLQSRINGFTAKLDFHVIPKIVSEQPSHQIKTTNWKIPPDFMLADPEFDKPGRIDCLLGAEIFFDLLTKGNMKLGDNLPTLQNTVFGWVVAGGVTSSNISTAICGVCTTVELEDLISKFWKLEEVAEPNTNQSEDDIKCERHFVQNTTRAKDGKFMVRLPLKEHPSSVGDTRELAYYRQKHIEKRLSADEKLKEQYNNFMKEYEALGHMTEVKVNNIPTPHYYIPHHYVLRPESTTTKLRVVFDASAHRAASISLNDVMHTGPRVQSELLSILLRFRTYRYVLKTDVEKMYRQIWVHPDDRNLQLVMWRENPLDRMKIYRLNTVTYGTRAAPYLATRCLSQLADENLEQFPGAACALKNNFYVDDGLVGADTLRDAKEIQQQLTSIFTSAGMKLKKWCANDPRLLHDIAADDLEIELDFDSDKDQQTKTLGLIWLPKSDLFGIKTNAQERESTTKRSVTSDVARIYDPLGLAGPVIVTAKIFIQQLWQLKLDWDETLPVDFQRQWDQFRNDLAILNQVRIPRYVFGMHDYIKVQLHVFADASERAYGAAVYIRTIHKDKTIKTNLLCSKSRVAPLKLQTIPRLELCAALLAAELIARVKYDLKWNEKPTYYWSDSQIVLSWINHQSGSLPPFVANRINKIRQISSVQQWFYIPSKQNPADILSRGLKPHDLLKSQMWLYGPLLLYEDENLWPPPYNYNNEMPIVASVTKQGPTEHPDESSWVYKISTKNSFSHVQRTIGYMLRFIHHARLPKQSRHEHMTLSPLELDAALRVIVRQVQRSEFSDVIKLLSKDKILPRSHNLSSLTPFLDEEGIIRVGGRIHCSSQPFDTIHQMVLPHNDPLVTLLIQKTHKENYHCGPQALLAQLRQRFWPLKGKSMVRSVIQKCVKCTRARPVFYSQIMGNLPSHRVQPARPFLNTGVDYCGPFLVHFRMRGKRPQKAYIAVFCCFATKAVHLELVTELTTAAFIGALKRFVARRGHCKTLYCDNATNFVGAKNHLKEIDDIIYSKPAQELIIGACSVKGIDFQFIPPRSPHFGGLWEAAVKSAKHLLMKNVSTSSLTYEELETVVIEIEAMLNSRPLIPNSSDANDLNAITPGHFLIGDQLTSNVDVNARDPKPKLLERWQLVSQLKHIFWQRWSKEYLNELQQRYKWKGPMREILPNTMVIIKEDNIPTLQWPLGRIVKVYKGEDGIVRVCDVKTQAGIFKRPVHKLAPLLPDNEEEEKEPKEPLQETTKSLIVSIPLDRIKDTNCLTPPTKRPRLNTSLMFTILTLCLLPLALGNQINITKFNNKPGIYFEQLSTVKLLTANWKMIVYFDLEPYQQQMDILSDGTVMLQKLCDNASNNTSCKFLLNYFDHVTEEMKAELGLLSVKRYKRGAIDIIGNFANSLFGVLDSNYATQMSNTIEGLKASDKHLDGLLKKQTSLIDSTINLVKEHQLNVQAKFDEIDEKIHMLLYSNRPINDIEVSQNILTLSVQMFIIVSNMQRMHSSIMDVLIDSHHNKLNPMLLTPQQLDEEIIKIKAHLPPNLQLPIDQQNLLEVYKLIKVTGILAKNHVIFNIDLPLTDPRELQLLHLIPITAVLNNTLSAIKMSTKFLVISPHRDEYFPMLQHQVDACLLLSNNELLCPNIQATYQAAALPVINKCEIDLINNRNDPRCDLQVMEDTTLWFQLHHPNQWIFATLNTIKINAVCGDDMIQLALESSGLMTLRPDCTIKNDLITIQGRQEIITTIQTSITKFRPTISWISQVADNNISTKPFRPTIKELDSLKQQLKFIQESTLPSQHITYHHHGLTLGYIIVALVSCLVFRRCWLRCRRKGTINLAPTPMPRNQNTEC